MKFQADFQSKTEAKKVLLNFVPGQEEGQVSGCGEVEVYGAVGIGRRRAVGADTVLIPLLPPNDIAEAGDAALQEMEAEQHLQHEEPRQEHLHENHGGSMYLVFCTLAHILH